MTFSLSEYKRLYKKMAFAKSRNNRGKTLEDLIEYLMNNFPGISVEERDIRTDAEEIDLLLWNNKRDDVLRVFDTIILVECKNWKSKVGASEVQWFISKLLRRRLKYGFLIARNGVTGTIQNDAHEIIMEALRQGIRIMVITREDLKKIEGTETFREMIKKKYCRLILGKIP